MSGESFTVMRLLRILGVEEEEPAEEDAIEEKARAEAMAVVRAKDVMVGGEKRHAAAAEEEGIE
jgi:hypothetical protein